MEQGFLYDFYGELLTEHQRQVYEDFVLNNLSLSEIAEEQGVSRQGIHDLVKRCDKILTEYESKLHLVEKFLDVKKDITGLQTIVKELRQSPERDTASSLKEETQLKKMEQIIEHLLENL